VLMVVAALGAPFVQRDVIMVGVDLRTLPACAPMSRTTVSNAFMSALNNRELWMWDPWNGDNVAGEDDVELDGWNLVPARRSPYGTRVWEQSERSATGQRPRLCGIGPPRRQMPLRHPSWWRRAPADQEEALLALILLEALDTPLCKMLLEGAAEPSWAW